MISRIRFVTACKRVIFVTFLAISLGPAFAFGNDSKRPEWAINEKGEVYQIFEIGATSVQAVRMYPTQSNRPELLPKEALIFSIPREHGAKGEDAVDTQTLEACFMAGRFPDGRIFLNTFGSRESRLIENDKSLLPAEIMNHREIRQEDGRIVSVLAKLRDGRFLTAHRPRTLVRGALIPNQNEQAQIAMGEIFKFPKLQPFFDYFTDGGAVDLNNKDARVLFHIYLAARLDTQFRGDYLTGNLVPKVADFIRKYKVPKKPDWPIIQIRTNAGRTLRLRPLSREEAAFRGCLGKDCSTRTRPLRALEPAHQYFAIEEMPLRPLGQIELVLGVSPNGRAIFLERIQSPKNLRHYELGGLIHGMVQFFEREQIEFFTLESVKTYLSGGHGLSNYIALEDRLKIMLKNYFEVDPKVRDFARDPDVFPQEDASSPHNLVAHHAAARRMPFHQLLARSLPTEIASLEWIPPKRPTKMKFPAHKQLRDELEMYLEPIKSKNPEVSNLVWRSVLNYFWFNCEYYLDNW